ncbi:hypothetical protein HDU96_002810, partial [Phlyctochytrium bullatum]
MLPKGDDANDHDDATAHPPLKPSASATDSPYPFHHGDYPQLLPSGTTPTPPLYLDAAGANPAPHPAVHRFAHLLSTTPLANPHSYDPHSPPTSATLTASLIEKLRSRVIRLCGGDPAHWAAVIVPGATAALRVVAECWDGWDRGGKFWYLVDAHTSVLGMRERAWRGVAGETDDPLEWDEVTLGAGRVRALGIREVEAYLSQAERQPPPSTPPSPPSLFAFPAQSNFNGHRYPLSWIPRFRALGWDVLLDSSSMGFPDLRGEVSSPTFAVVSFYKAVGFPTGLGVLLVQRGALRVRPRGAVYGGGTVEAVDWAGPWRKIKDGVSGWEDGTVNFLDCVAADCALEWAESRGGWETLKRNAEGLAEVARRRMRELRVGGVSICRVYEGGVETAVEGPRVPSSPTQPCGPIIAFNLFTPSRRPIPASEVARLAALHGIQVRHGCFCNLGACAYHLGMGREAVRVNAEAGVRVCGGGGDGADVLNGVHVTAVRVSFGPANVPEDVERWIGFLVDQFVAPHGVEAAVVPSVTASTVGVQARVRSLHVYPVKSCGGVEVERWPVTRRGGLAMDRAFMVVEDASGRAMTAKRWPRRPATSNADASRWFSTFLNTPCRLVSLSESDATDIGFHNDAQILAVSASSFEQLRARAAAVADGVEGLALERFRANVVVEGLEAFGEEGWRGKEVEVGGVRMKVDGPCKRCGVIGKTAFTLLSKYYRREA